jgi:hypothetical protein
MCDIVTELWTCFISVLALLLVLHVLMKQRTFWFHSRKSCCAFNLKYVSPPWLWVMVKIKRSISTSVCACYSVRLTLNSLWLLSTS